MGDQNYPLDPRPRPAQAVLEVSDMVTTLQKLTEDPDRALEAAVYTPGYHPASFDLVAIQHDASKAVDAQIIECDPSGNYRLKSYDKASLLNRLSSAPVIEASPTHRVTLKEAMGRVYSLLREEGGDFDRVAGDISTQPFETFTPLFIGPFYRQQYMYKMLEAKSKCYEAYNNNPVAHRIPQLITQFTLGKGVTAVCKDKRTQEVWDQFATLNKIGTSVSVGSTRAGSRLRMWSNQLSVDGELMFQFIGTKDGLRIKNLDTATILDIVTEPEDIERVFYYHQQYTTQFQMYVTNGIPGIKYVIRDIPGDDVLHVKINCYENEKRGRSDLYSIIGYLKRMKDLISANILKAYFQACYTFDYAIDGDETAIKRFASQYKNSIPTPGASYFHNKNVVRTLLSPTSGTGAGSDNDMIGLMNLISLGSGVPPAYLIGTMAANRAAVLSETEPSSKFFFERQSIWDETLHGMFDRLLRWHYDQTGEMLDDEIEFSFPPINAIDRQAYLNALQIMTQNKWFKTKRAAELAAKEWNATSYDYDEEVKEIEKEARENIQRELDLNKYRSTAQSQLRMWQTNLAQAQAQAETEEYGASTPQGGTDEQGNPIPAGGAGSAPAGGQAAPAKQTAKPAAKPAAKPGKTTGTKAGSATGGVTDRERASTTKRVKSAGHD